MAKLESLHVGDRVQVLGNGLAIDVTNGVRSGSRYVEGSTEWGTIQRIDSNWVAAYGDNAGKKVNKVRILGVDNSTIVWQVEPQHVSDNIMHMNDCGPKEETKPTPNLPPTSDNSNNNTQPVVENFRESRPPTDEYRPSGAVVRDSFVTTADSGTWRPVGSNASQFQKTMQTETSSRVKLDTAVGHKIKAGILESLDSISAVRMTKIKKPEEAPGNMIYQDNIERVDFDTMISNPDKLKLLLNDERSIIQNTEGFPYKERDADPDTYIAAKYDYRINLGDYRTTPDLETQLMNARAAFGIPVHGSTDKARQMRYYLYNRFKHPDTNLAFNRTFTHVFFTRPDLNILTGNPIHPTITDQCRHHTESSMLWMQNPTLFRLLVDRKRISDYNNFNLLLSNSVTSIQVEDESISTIEAGKSWHGYTMQYGNHYTGRDSGTVSIGFLDDKLFSVFNLIKLWMTYIDNVGRGAWMPSYDLWSSELYTEERERYSGREFLSKSSHVYSKTLDYASSIYVFKVSEDGSEILYWTKYYGVFPTNTGSQVHSWNLSDPASNPPNLVINFRYSFKRDMSPVSLLEFNHNANISGTVRGSNVQFENPWAEQYNHSNRPYVGTPFVEFTIPSEEMDLSPNSAATKQRAQIRLRFLPDRYILGGNQDHVLFTPNIRGMGH